MKDTTNTPQNPSRRIFFKTVIQKTTMTAIVNIPQYYSARILKVLLDPRTFTDESPPEPEMLQLISEYPNDIMINNKKITNFGVAHTQSYLSIQRTKLYEAIQKNDIILVEAETDQRKYFDDIVQYAKEQTKIIYKIDPKNNEIMLGLFGISLFSLNKNFSAMIEYFQNKISSRRFLTISALGSILSLIGISSPLYFLGKKLRTSDNNYESEARFDYSFLADGRTIGMLENIENIIQSFPNKKILVITGANHARGFTYYSKNPENYHHKKKFFNFIYKIASSQEKKIN